MIVYNGLFLTEDFLLIVIACEVFGVWLHFVDFIVVVFVLAGNEIGRAHV